MPPQPGKAGGQSPLSRRHQLSQPENQAPAFTLPDPPDANTTLICHRSFVTLAHTKKGINQTGSGVPKAAHPTAADGYVELLGGCAPRGSRSRRPAAMPRLRSPQQRSQRQPRRISEPRRGAASGGASRGCRRSLSSRPEPRPPAPRPALTDAQQRCPEGETEPRVQQREPRHGGGAERSGAGRSGAADTGPAGRERVT